MQRTLRLLTFPILFCSLQCVGLAQSTLLDNVTNFEFGTPVNDVVYDSSLDVLYASVPSSGGSLANSIATIDPSNGSVLSSVFVGDNPNTLAISDDGSHIFVGLDGDQGVRSFQPATGTLSPILPLTVASGAGGFFVNDAIAQDIAVLPSQPSVAVISTDTVGSTASGVLTLFDISTSTTTQISTSFLNGSNNVVEFLNPTTLITQNTASSSFDVTTFSLNGTTLTELSQSRVGNGFDVMFDIGDDDRLFFSDGRVVDSATLSPLGLFNTGFTGFNFSQQLVEPVTDLDLVYFVGDSGGNITLSAFDTNNFLQVDSITLPTSLTFADDGGDLIVAGQNRLAFVFKEDEFDGAGGPGTLNIISGVPTAAVPEPSSLTLMMFVGGLLVTRRQRVPA